MPTPRKLAPLRTEDLESDEQLRIRLNDTMRRLSQVSAATGSAADVVTASLSNQPVGLVLPSAIADSAASSGTGTTLAKVDHVHAHGNRSGGSLHAVASRTASGFMTSLDKYALGSTDTATVTTTDATPTVLWQGLLCYPNFTGVGLGRAVVVADGTQRGAFGKTCCIYANTPLAGVLVGTADDFADLKSSAGMAAVWSLSGAKGVLTVTGVAATTINWRATVQVYGI